MNPIEKAFDLCGGKTGLANLLGIASPTVHQWASGARPIPLERCVDIEKATDGKVTCEELRPDKADYWAHFRRPVN